MSNKPLTTATVVNTGNIVIYMCIQLSVDSTKLLMSILCKSSRQRVKIRVRKKGNDIIVTNGRCCRLYFQQNRVRFGGLFLEKMKFEPGDVLSVSEVRINGERGLLLSKIAH